MEFYNPVNKKRNLWEYYIVFLIFLVSGTQYFYMLNGRYTILLYLISSFIFVYKYGRRKMVDSTSKFFLLFFLFWVSFNFFVLNTNHDPVSEIQYYLYVMLIVPTYFVLTTFRFDRFRYLYLNVCSILAAISIFVYIGVEIGIFLPKLIDGVLFFLFHNLGWAKLFHRLAGLYWEPGAYAIILNTALILYLNDILANRINKSDIKKLSIIILALLLTQSTAGYICLISILILVAVTSNYLKKHLFLGIIGMIAIFLICLFLYNSPVIQSKMNQAGIENSSYEIRMSDNLAMIKLIEERPIYGYGVSSKEMTQRSNILGNYTNSNGILSMGSKFGLVFLFVYFLVLLIQLKKMYGRKALFVFPLIMILNGFEVFFYFPIAYLFIFKMKSSRDNYISNI